ncbi:ribonuclease Z [Cohnella xylanilytica]|uniref:Ribonuclease Z n=1 Tax=Cohnella xylanilytica TaxID=557555 RepID=A0A841UC61_9BACL|nr:ribonuclease Z [Cohnella xylanilytica]MBB6695541.1 ribonuclease Z [Cohnella xylanilytica]
MKLIFLGTSAGRPTPERNVMSVALRFPEERNRFWLFDAGEGTQHRLLGTKLKLSKLDRIFITHMHGDHLYGLPGLLTSRTFHDGAGKLRVYGPKGLADYLGTVLRVSEAHLNYELEVSEIEPGDTLDLDDRFSVETAELDHRIPCIGYRITERPRPGALDLAALARLGVPPGPLYGKLKRGEDVALDDGSTILSSEVVGPPSDGRIVTILGDTSPCDNAVKLARNADVLVHEATFGAGMEEKALDYGHSTITQAAGIARRAKAKRLIVTHISARYGEEEVAAMVAEARKEFPELEAARDYLEVGVTP